MPRYEVAGDIVISAKTIVEAGSEEEALAIARRRGILTLRYTGSKEEPLNNVSHSCFLAEIPSYGQDWEPKNLRFVVWNARGKDI